MNSIDVFLILPLLWSIYKGFKRGLIIEVATLIAFLLGTWGGIHFSDIAGNYLSSFLDVSEHLLPIIAFAVTFVLIVVVINLIAKVLSKIISMVALGFVNRIGGAVFGGLKVAFILSVLFSFVHTINNKIHYISQEEQDKSLLYQPIISLAPWIIPKLEILNLTEILEQGEETITQENAE